MNIRNDFIGIIKQNEGIIFKIARAYAADREDQKDLYQEIVYQLWKSFDTFRGASKISTWIYRIALNTSITHSKKEKRKGNRLSVDLARFHKPDEEDNVIEERIKTMYAHIKMLNIIDKGIMLLFLEGKSYNEIAAITGFTPTNVGTRLNRMKQKLRSQIKK